MPIGKRLACVAAPAALLFGGCESSGGAVSVHESASVPVVAGSTYAWAPLSEQKMQIVDPRVDNDALRGRIKSAVDYNLSAKGYRQVSDPAAAELIVSYYVGLRAGADQGVRSYTGSPGSAYDWGMYGAPSDSNVWVKDYTEGTLILDLKDSASGKLAWRATSQKRVEQGDGAQDKLNAMVADMTKALPALAPAAT